MNSNGVGQIQYINSNGVGSTTTIRYRATTTAPIGTSPTDSVGIINNTNGTYIANTLLYSNTVNTLASTDLVYNSNVFTIGPSSRIVSENANSFTSFSNGGSITAMGDSSIAKNLIVGQKIGIANTSPSFTLDVNGDINFTGNFYKNNSLYIGSGSGSGSSVWQTNGTDVFYTAGNIGIGTTSPSQKLSVSGGITVTTDVSSASLFSSNATITNLVTTNQSNDTLIVTNITAGSITSTTFINSSDLSGSNSTITNILATNISTSVLYSTFGSIGTISSTLLSGSTITGGRLSLSGDLNVAGALTVVNITSTNIVNTNVSAGIVLASTLLSAPGTSNTISNIFTTGGNVGIATTSPGATLDVTGSVCATTSITTGALYSINQTTTNIVSTRLSTGTLTVNTATFPNIFITNSTIANIQGTTILATTQVSSGALYSNNQTTTNIVATNISSGMIQGSNTTVTNAVHTTLSSGTAIFTTGLTTATLLATTSVSAGSLNATNTTITNAVHTNISSASLYSTIGSFGTVSSTLLSASTITGGALSLSGNLNVAGALTVTNITSTNLVDTNVSAGIVLASTSLSAPGNSNTFGSIITTGGNVGIGTTSPSYKLHVSGDIYASGDITAFSDFRLKENIVQLTNCLNKIDNIRGVSFDRIDNGTKHIGLIAQEIEVEFPELVYTDINNGLKSVNYGNMVAVLLECIRELKEEVKQLKTNH